jgi:anaerobic selenocysteine-containing dehydrogenase
MQMYDEGGKTFEKRRKHVETIDQKLVRLSSAPADTRSFVRGACPLDCPDGCSWIVTVQDGKATGLQGAPDHPFTSGALCAKMNGYLSHVSAPDRLLYPLRRIGKKGEGRFERISWDDAIGEIATKLANIITTYGGEAIWPYQGTGTLGYLQGLEGRAGSRLWNVLGASRHEPTICSIAGSIGSQYTVGVNRGIDPETLQYSRLILLWGTNTLTSGHHLWKFLLAARRKGAYIVAIDPIRTRTAAQADQHIAPIPGTDAALALGLLNVIVEMGAEDLAFIDEHTSGWEQYRARIAQFSPSRAATITGIDENTIIALGRRIATTRPTAIRATMGLQRHAGGGMTLRTLASIPGVTGDWKQFGGGLTYSTSGYFPANRAALWRDDLLTRAVRSLNMSRLGEGLTELSDPPVQVLVVYGSNPMASVPNQNKVRRGLEREDLFTVVIEQFATDTVSYADIVLPSTMQVEHADLHDGYGHLYIAWNAPAVPPPGECLPHTEMFRRIARAMGLEEPALYESDEELARQLLQSEHPALHGITLERLQRDGWARLTYPEPFVPFMEGFPTPSGKLEFFSERAAAAGYDPLPGYTPPYEITSTNEELIRRFPLVLLAPASHFFLNSMFANKPDLLRKAGPPWIVLHPVDAERRGLKVGDRVHIYNDRGRFIALVEISDRVRPSVAATTKGYWPKNQEGGTNINATVAERDTDIGFGPVFHDNRVEVALAP